MDDAQRVIAELSPEQAVERAKATMLELDCWRQVIADGAKVNDAVLAGTTAVLDATAAALVLTPTLSPEQVILAGAIVEQHRLALDALKAICDALDGTLDLAVGRLRSLEPARDALMVAAGLADDDDAAGGADVRQLLGSSASAELERELVRLERRLRAELRRELDARMLELTRYIDGELEAIDSRIDGVHTRALRALTHLTEARKR